LWDKESERSDIERKKEEEKQTILVDDEWNVTNGVELRVERGIILREWSVGCVLPEYQDQDSYTHSTSHNTLVDPF